MTEHEQLAQDLVERVGGIDNIRSVTHCTTRVRLKLRRLDKVDSAAVENLAGVISVKHASGQFQVVVGSNVAKIYQQIEAMLPEPSELEPRTESLSLNFIDIVTGIFAPILGLLAGAGILKGFLTLFTTIGWIPLDSGAYRLLEAAGDSTFFFLPIFLGYSASKLFGGRPFIGMAIGASLVHPDVMNYFNLQVSNQASGSMAAGDSFLGIPIQYLDYSSSVIPIIFACWINVKLERLLEKWIPKDAQYIFIAAFCLLISVPLTFLMIGPLAASLGHMINNIVMELYHASPLVAGAVLGFFWQVLVIFGLHWSLVLIPFNNIAFNGFDVIMPLLLPAVLGQAGACFGVFLKATEKKLKTLSGSACLTALCGITEPAVYGITLRRRRIFIFGCLSGALGGAIIGAYETKLYALGFMNIFFFPQLIPPEGADMSVLMAIVASILTFVMATLLTFFFHSEYRYSDEREKPANENERETEEVSTPIGLSRNRLMAPLEGRVIPLSQVPDSTFSSMIMGKGVAIQPNSDLLCSPVNGTVRSLFKTKHAIGILSDEGVEILIHIGLDTVRLNGDGFDAFVERGQHVKVGEALIKFDRHQLIEKGFDTTTPIIVSNSDDYLDVIVNSDIKAAQYSDPLIYVI